MRLLSTWFLAVMATAAVVQSQRLTIDHTTADMLAIPDQWTDSVHAKIVWHYSHSSHGRQIVEGMDSLERSDPKYAVNYQMDAYTTEPGSLNIYDRDMHVADYFAAVRSDLTLHPDCNVSMHMWCLELSYSAGTYPDEVQWTPERVQGYLDTLNRLEGEFPGVVFVYATATAQHITADASYRRMQMNQQIRDYCRVNNKVLFDFEDLDAWDYNDTTGVWALATVPYGENGQTIQVPVLNPVYGNPDDHGLHANTRAELVKAAAAWWMLARLAGWDGAGAATGSRSCAGLGPSRQSRPRAVCLSLRHGAHGASTAARERGPLFSALGAAVGAPPASLPPGLLIDPGL